MSRTGKAVVRSLVLVAIVLGGGRFSFSDSVSMPRSWGGAATDYAYSVAFDSKATSMWRARPTASAPVATTC